MSNIKNIKNNPYPFAQKDDATASGQNTTASEGKAAPLNHNFPTGLSREHRALLANQHNIAGSVAVGRQYATLNDETPTDRKTRMGFVGAQALIRNGIIAPLHSLDGCVCGYRFIPDHPRETQGGPVHIEDGHQTLPTLDLNPAGHRLLNESDKGLFYVLNPISADSLISAGAAAFCLSAGTTPNPAAQWREFHRLAVEFRNFMDGRELERVHVLLYDSTDGTASSFDPLTAMETVLRSSQSDIIVMRPALAPTQPLQSVRELLKRTSLAEMLDFDLGE